jgi:hypothetical protein
MYMNIVEVCILLHEIRTLQQAYYAAGWKFTQNLLNELQAQFWITAWTIFTLLFWVTTRMNLHLSLP